MIDSKRPKTPDEKEPTASQTKDCSVVVQRLDEEHCARLFQDASEDEESTSRSDGKGSDYHHPVEEMKEGETCSDPVMEELFLSIQPSLNSPPRPEKPQKEDSNATTAVVAAAAEETESQSDKENRFLANTLDLVIDDVIVDSLCKMSASKSTPSSNKTSYAIAAAEKFQSSYKSDLQENKNAVKNLKRNNQVHNGSTTMNVTVMKRGGRPYKKPIPLEANLEHPAPQYQLINDELSEVQTGASNTLSASDENTPKNVGKPTLESVKVQEIPVTFDGIVIAKMQYPIEKGQKPEPDVKSKKSVSDMDLFEAANFITDDLTSTSNSNTGTSDNSGQGTDPKESVISPSSVDDMKPTSKHHMTPSDCKEEVKDHSSLPRISFDDFMKSVSKDQKDSSESISKKNAKKKATSSLKGRRSLSGSPPSKAIGSTETDPKKETPSLSSEDSSLVGKKQRHASTHTSTNTRTAKPPDSPPVSAVSLNTSSKANPSSDESTLSSKEESPVKLDTDELAKLSSLFHLPEGVIADCTKLGLSSPQNSVGKKTKLIKSPTGRTAQKGYTQQNIIKSINNVPTLPLVAPKIIIGNKVKIKIKKSDLTTVRSDTPSPTALDKDDTILPVPTARTQYICQVCRVDLQTKRMVWQHFRQLHLHPKKTVRRTYCGICPAKPTNKHEWARHTMDAHVTVVEPVPS